MSIIIRKIVYSICILLTAVYTACAQTAPRTESALSADHDVQLNIVYTVVNGWQGKLDLYLPKGFYDPRPLLINIHGGGWNKGSKETQGGFSRFLEKGYAVANIEYRLVQVAPAPAAVEDVRCALNYLISQSGNYSFDLSKIILMGASAGGHLALMAGLLENDGRFDKNCKRTRKTNIAAIIDKFGITDVWDWAHGPSITNEAAVKWLGKEASNREFAVMVSPLTYVKHSSPPVFIVHGSADTIVSAQQSLALHNKLDSAGVINEYMIIPGGYHGNFTEVQNTEVQRRIMLFLRRLHIHA